LELQAWRDRRSHDTLQQAYGEPGAAGNDPRRCARRNSPRSTVRIGSDSLPILQQCGNYHADGRAGVSTSLRRMLGRFEHRTRSGCRAEETMSTITLDCWSCDLCGHHWIAEDATRV